MKLNYLILLTGVFLLVLTACSSDCIYKLFDDDDGAELCGKFCPLEDEEGNEVLDDDGDIVYDKPEVVDKVNCILPSTSRSSSSSSTTTSSSTTN